MSEDRGIVHGLEGKRHREEGAGAGSENRTQAPRVDRRPPVADPAVAEAPPVEVSVLVYPSRTHAAAATQTTAVSAITSWRRVTVAASPTSRGQIAVAAAPTRATATRRMTPSDVPSPEA